MSEQFAYTKADDALLDELLDGIDQQQAVPQPLDFKSCLHDAAEAATQKVRGLRAANKVARLSCGLFADHLGDWRYIKAQDALKATAADLSRYGFHHEGYFVRPCPVTPRHGFVDSVKLAGGLAADAHFRQIAQDTVNADPEGELMVVPFIDAAHSAILTPNTFSYGEGHEGATSGQSRTIYGPALAGYQLDTIKERATIHGEGDVPYCEIVYRKGDKRGYLVQVRGGPAQQLAEDYVPHAVTVGRVIVAAEGIDLGVWEKTIEEAEPGAVVHAPGLSLASHYCVHAVVNGVPCLTTREPQVGETLEPTGAPEWTAEDWQRLAKFVGQAEFHVTGDYLGMDLARFAVAALHCAGTPAPTTDEQLRFLALGAVSAAKHIAAACVGEARHASSNSQHRVSDGLGDLAYEAFNQLSENEDFRRNYYYERAGNASLEALEAALYAVSTIYRKRRWSTSFGGAAWAGINAGVRQLCGALVKFKENPNAGTWATVVKHWNNAIHREHNGNAPALNKFGVGSDVMNNAAQWPLAVVAGSTDTSLRSVFDVLHSRQTWLIEKVNVHVPGKKTSEEERRSGAIMVRPSNAHSDVSYIYRQDNSMTMAKVSNWELIQKAKAASEDFTLSYHHPAIGKRVIPAQLDVRYTSQARVNQRQGNAYATLCELLGVSIKFDSVKTVTKARIRMRDSVTGSIITLPLEADNKFVKAVA